MGLVDDREDLGNGLVDNANLGQLGCCTAGDLGDAQLQQLYFESCSCFIQQLLFLLAA